VITQKGKGYPPAEMSPDRFHGVPPFVVETGELRSGQRNPPSYTEVFGETLCQLARGNRRLIAITAAMQSGTGLEEFARQFPDRFYDIGIAEQHAVTFAAGLALEGPTHHGLFDFSYLRHIPNLIIMVPKDENEFGHMIKTATECPFPTAFRYPRGRGVGVKRDDSLQSIVLGKGEVLREGQDILIVAIGTTVYPSLRAAEKLAEMGIQATVINSRFLKPLDGNLLCDWAKRTDKVLTVEENVLQGGFGSAVLELFQERGLISVQVKRLGIPDIFVEHGPQALLREKYGIDENGIVEGVKKVFEEGYSERRRNLA
jgi:1-deoxy-D-xylulose-5-phosphate synthase